MTEVELTISGNGSGVGRHEPSGFRLVATLGLAGLMSGLVLALAHEITAPRIQANQRRLLESAVLEVVPGAAIMQPLTVRDGRLEAALPDSNEAARIFGAYDEDRRFLGYAITGAGPGYQDTIGLLYGYDPRMRHVVGMYVLESRETPGLGDRIYKDDAFRANFAALAVDPEVVLVKGGRSAANEVDAITGATISSRAVVRIINDAHETWQPLLPPTGAEPMPREETESADDDAPEGGG